VTVEEHHSAFPKLMGAPAYARPPAPVAQVARPFDPDELPLQIEQTPEERALAEALVGTSRTADAAAGVLVSQVPAGGFDGAYLAPGGSSVAPNGAVAHAGGGAPAGSPQGVPGRPFFLRDLTDRIRARR
jgi:hypothetical protein